MTMLAPLEVGICCADLDTLAAFYTGVLGFTAVGTIEVPAEKAAGTGLCDSGYQVTRLQTPYGERIKLLQPATPPAESAPAARILDRRNTVYLTFIIDNLHGMLDRLRGAGVEPLTGPEPVEVRPGTVLAFVRDPEGNVLEFVQYADVRAYRPDL